MDAMRGYYRQWEETFDEVSTELEDLIVAGDKLVAAVRGLGRMKGSDAKVDIHYANRPDAAGDLLDVHARLGWLCGRGALLINGIEPGRAFHGSAWACQPDGDGPGALIARIREEAGD